MSASKKYLSTKNYTKKLIFPKKSKNKKMVKQKKKDFSNVVSVYTKKMTKLLTVILWW